MIELKTLKDMSNEFISHSGKKTLNRVDVKELRAEAVKWVKDLEKDIGIEKEADFLDKKKVILINVVQEWIKFFFNLTEEDLNEGEE